MIFHAKEHTLTLPNCQMNYITFGNGTKNLIMIQGLSTRDIKGTALPLAYMYRLFAKDYKVYLFDRRANLPQHITIRELAEDLALAMDTLNISIADVIGVSQGGMIGQYLAIDRPDLVNKLVLAVTFARNNDIVLDAVQNWITLTNEGRMKELVLDMAEKLYSDAYLKRYHAFMPLLTLLQKPKDIQRFITLAESCLTCDTYESLNKIQCPVLVLGGSNDKIVGANASIEIAEKLNCPIYMYENLGHAAYEEAKDFNQRILDFLK